MYHHIPLVWEKIKIQNLKCGFLRMCYCFHIIVKSKNRKLSHKSGPAVMTGYLGRIQSPEYSSVLFYTTAVYAMHFSQMPILIRNRFLEVFSNLKSLLHSSLLVSFYVNSTLFRILLSAFWGLFLQAHACRKVEMEINWYSSL